jgi:nitrogen-specific signal transduction histidine kinase
LRELLQIPDIQIKMLETLQTGKPIVNQEILDKNYGIAPNLIQHVFDPSFTTKDEGTGLGLSVSKKIIENYHGTMNVKSSPLGTHFLIYLPVHKAKIPLYPIVKHFTSRYITLSFSSNNRYERGELCG